MLTNRSLISIIAGSALFTMAAIASAAPVKAPKAPKAPNPVPTAVEGELVKVAVCNDGKAYYAPTNRHNGACRGHGGVAQWADGSPVKSRTTRGQYR